jgi:hypothetical protein
MWQPDAKSYRQLTHRGGYASLTAVVLVVALISQAFARYDWCSRDPVITLTRDNALLPQRSLDVQVVMPLLDGLAAADTATLTTKTPSNVIGAAPVFGGEPAADVFNLRTIFENTLAAAANDSYSIQLAAFVQDTDGDYPVRLVVTNLVGGSVPGLSAECQGRTGKMLAAWVRVEPFQVTCIPTARHQTRLPLIVTE